MPIHLIFFLKSIIYIHIVVMVDTDKHKLLRALYYDADDGFMQICIKMLTQKTQVLQ